MPEMQEYFCRQIDIMKQQATVFDLGSCLIKPVQRVLKYPLLLNELIQVCKPVQRVLKYPLLLNEPIQVFSQNKWYSCTP